MARQGSLCQPAHRCGSIIRASVFLCALNFVWSSASLQPCVAQVSAAGDSHVDVNLRLTWSAGQSQFWQVRVAVAAKADGTEASKISQLVNRCDSLAATGSFQIADDGSAVTFTPREPLAGGEFEFRFQGSSDTQLNVQVLGNAHYTRSPAFPSDGAWSGHSSKLLPVNELVRGQTASEPTETEQADPTAVTWSIARTSDDQLRIEGLSKSGFSEVSDTFSFSVRANALTAWTSQDLSLVYNLRQASTGKVVTEKRWPLNVDANGNSVSVDIDEPSPAVAGVYEISCRLEKDDDHLLMRLRRRPSLIASTSVPILVTVPATAGFHASGSGTQQWQKVGRIQPATDSEWELNQWLPNSSKRLIRRIDPRESSSLRRSKHAGQPVSVLQPAESFVASLPSRQASSPHKITIRYPAGKQTRLLVEIDTSEEFKQPSRVFLVADDQHVAARETWRTHTFVHYPRPRDEFIRLTNQAADADSEFASITVESGGASLAVAAENQEPASRIAALHVSGFQWVDQLTTDIADSASQRQLHPNTQALHRLVVAAERLIDYAEAAGMNSVVVQASEGDRTWFETESLLPNSTASPFTGRYLESLMRVADGSSLQVIVRLDLSMNLSRIESEIRANEELKGVLRRSGDSAIRYNTQHPLVETHVRGLLAEVHEQLRQHGSYAGLALNCSDGTHLAPISQRHLDLPTVQSFAKGAGKANMTQSQLHAWLQGEGSQPLLSWMQNRSQQLYRSLTKDIDTNVYLFMGGQTGLVESGSEANLATVVDLRRYASESLDNETSSSKRAANRKANKRITAVMLGEWVNENAYAKSFMRIESTKDLTDVVVGLDPEMLIVDDSALTLGLSPSVREMLSGFSALPKSPLREVPGVDAAARTVRVRFAKQDQDLVLVLNNLAPWSSDVQLDLASDLNWTDAIKVDGGINDPTSERNSWNIDQRRLNASLTPGGMIVLKATAPPGSAARPPIRAWSSRVSGGSQAMTDIKDKVTAVVERIGALSDPQAYEHLSNGGFEKTGGVGIPGWMHTQHPQGAVRIDDREAIVGSQSVVLTNDQRNSSRAWLVSETITPPASGRLAVSLACRGELTSGDATHRLRVSIEGIRSGQPFRQTNEFEIPRDGQWQPRKVVLEAVGVNPSDVDSIRLTIDSLSSGRVWIDEVHLHDWFPTISERGELQGEAFLAVQGLQRGDVTPAARLLHNYWAQYLIHEKHSKQLAPVLQTTQQEEEPAGMAERIKSWLPRPLRF